MNNFSLIQLKQPPFMLMYSTLSKGYYASGQRPVIHSNVIAAHSHITGFHLSRLNASAFAPRHCSERLAVQNWRQFKPHNCQSWNILTLAHRWISFTASPVMQGGPGNLVDCLQGDKMLQIKWCDQTDIRHVQYSNTAAEGELYLRCAAWIALWSLLFLQSLFSS